MSPASKSKSKDKKMGKEPMKASGKLAGSANGSGVPLSAYNPVLGSFHALELETSSSVASNQVNGRFRGMDENEINGHLVGTGGEFDAVSNNGSWSGESEEHKEKLSNQSIRPESVPGTENDKREKNRQKNERKHQRQKERRNLELREKCGGYLMSRKLEYLSQQLVAMGFSAERSTMALILNEGKVDQSVAWLIDEGVDDEVQKDSQRDQKFGACGNLKIDISEELARIAELEIRYKCTRQEVERAVVACEGDIDKAAETLKSQKQEPSAVAPNLEETGDPPTPVTNDLKNSSTTNPYLTKAPPRPKSSSSYTSQVRDEKDFNYTKTVATNGMLLDNGKNVVLIQQKRVLPQADWSKSPQIVQSVGEKKWPVPGTSSQVTSPAASPLQLSPRPPSAELRYTVSVGESRNIQQIGAVQEPVTVIQRQQPHTSKPFVVTSIATSTHTTMPSWHPLGGSDFTGNGVGTQMPSSRSFYTNNISPNQLYQQRQQTQLMYQQQNLTDTTRHPKTNGVVSKLATSSTLTPASCLGLFPGTISPNIPSGSSSPVDWLNGFEMRQIDYANIDWSLNRNTTPLSPSMKGSHWSDNGIGSSQSFTANGTHLIESRNGVAALRPGSSNGNNGSRVGTAIPTTIGGEAVNLSTAMHDWSSPFEENDMFSLPRQFASSHSIYEGHRGV